MPEFDQELIEEVLSYTGKNCVITGSESFEMVHLEHRGQGGDPTKNTVNNILPVRKDLHDLYDGRRKRSVNWNGCTIEDIRFKEWKPREEKLVVEILESGEWKELSQDELWYYKRPTQVKAEEAWQHHQMVLEGKRDIGQGIIKMGAGLTPIKENEEWQSMGYNSWHEYCDSPEVSIGTRKADRAVKIYSKLVEKLEVDPERLTNIDQVKLEEVTKVADENNKDEWLSQAEQLSREDLRRNVREVKGDSLTKSCSNCARTVVFEFDLNFDQLSFGSRQFSYCPVKPSQSQGHLIETYTPQEQREIAENCDKYEEK